LTELRHQFVSTIRKLADRARKQRFDSLTTAIKSLDEALQPELQYEILVDLDAKSVNVQSLAFRKVRGDIKTEKVRSVNMDNRANKRLQLTTSSPDMDREPLSKPSKQALPGPS
jgi:hypothetical protein